MTTDALPPQMEPDTAGMLLREARQSAGLSLDWVAQQLKLAPRQVEALEGGDFSRLPGRTFVRGFMRNYARLVHLDPEIVLAALPGTTAAPSLAAPTLHATASSIGELPNAERPKSGWTRWAIPLALIAIVVGAAYYEYSRSGGAPARNDTPRIGPPAKSIGETTTMLPNPVAAQDPLPAPIGPPDAPVEPEPAAVAPAPQPAATATAAAVDDATIALSYRDFSWTEVRDRNGRVLLARMMRGGEQQALTGTPPFDVVIGNSADVKLSYRGKPVDLATLSRGNVARFTLK